MSFELTCRDCGQAFDFSEGEVKWYEAHALVPPKRCKECRAARKQRPPPALDPVFDEKGRPVWQITCSICNSPAAVPFRPVPGWPVFCQECYKKTPAPPSFSGSSEKKN
jgi:CxxC-x17-CxxC domain-containing protein